MSEEENSWGNGHMLITPVLREGGAGGSEVQGKVWLHSEFKATVA